MIDTIRLTGDDFKLNFQPSESILYREKNGEIYPLQSFLTTPKFRIFQKKAGSTTVELSVPKLLFGENGLNYLVGEYQKMQTLVENIGNFFFKGDFYISRIDIGAVVMVDDVKTELKFYREFKQRTARVSKYNHQNYADSVFYFSKEYAMKIYDKYKESKNEKHKNLLRYEMTIRSSMLEKILSEKKKPYYGIRCDKMDYKKIVDYYFERFQNYAVRKTVKEVRGDITPLQKTMLTIKENNPELFRQMISEKAVSRQTIARMQRHVIDTKEVKILNWENIHSEQVNDIFAMSKENIIYKLST